jgi:hypothetical protein
MDRISKYPFAYPLKSKNAEEIAEKLLDCISFISPTRSIQSDLGSEFINKIIEKMLTATGMDRRASSAPTSQGLVEKI